MNITTDVTIISTNINRKFLDKYNDYYLVDGNYNLEELLGKEKIIFFECLNKLNDFELSTLFETLREHNILFVNITNNIEEAIFTQHLVVYDKENILIEGPTIEVLKEEKLLKRIGLELPFMVELSLLLKDYNLVNKIYLDKESLVSDLWN